MDENEFRLKLNELSMAYPDNLEEYDNDMTWTENRVILFKNRYAGPWNPSAANTEYLTIKRYLESLNRS